MDVMSKFLKIDGNSTFDLCVIFVKLM